MTLDRATATYARERLPAFPIEAANDRRAFEHLTAGVRNAVVFGAGAEFAVDRAVAALLERRVRTHAVLDAIGTADEVRAQSVVARWKRRGVDGVTVGTLARLLTRPRRKLTARDAPTYCPAMSGHPSFKTMMNEVVAFGSCCECGSCVLVCPHNVIDYVDGKPKQVAKATAAVRLLWDQRGHRLRRLRAGLSATESA